MSLHPISLAGLRPIDQLRLSHHLRFPKDQNALLIALELLSSPYSGAPVIDSDGKFLGFISEFDLLAALESGRDLEQLQAAEIMVQDRKAVQSSATIAETVRIMKDHHLLVLPVERDGVVIGSITRRDVLRAWVQLALGQKPL